MFFGIGKLAVRTGTVQSQSEVAAPDGGIIYTTTPKIPTFKCNIQSVAGTPMAEFGLVGVATCTHYVSTDTNLSSVNISDYFVDDFGEAYEIQYVEINNTFPGKYWCLYVKRSDTARS